MQQPWYKQFWPWFLISLPVTVMIVCGVIIYLSVSQGNFQWSLMTTTNAAKPLMRLLSTLKKRRDVILALNLSPTMVFLSAKTGKPEELSALKVHFVPQHRRPKFRFNGDRQRGRNLLYGNTKRYWW